MIDRLELHNRYRIANIEEKAAIRPVDMPFAPIPDDTQGAGGVCDLGDPYRGVDREDGPARAARVGRSGRPLDRLRIGHTITGAIASPAPITGCGWECDKLGKEGIEAQFAGMIDKLANDCGVRPGERAGFVATHVDSWENGSQNWTARMPEEFQNAAVTTCCLGCP